MTQEQHRLGQRELIINQALTLTGLSRPDHA
jgi:hypothetical protein